MSAKTDNTFEKKMARLQEIVAALESGDLPLEKGMALYKEGAACSRNFPEPRDQAPHEVVIWRDGQARPLESRPVAASGLNAEEEAE